MTAESTLAKLRIPKSVLTPLGRAIVDVVRHVPTPETSPSQHPEAEARKIAFGAARKAALISGGAAMPPGPLGLITLVPDIVGVWKIQSQMVADIAGLYGKRAQLNTQSLMWCLFRHASGQVMRDVVVRAGQRFVIRQASSEVMERLSRRIGGKIAQRLLGRGISRWLPMIGALGMGAYAFYDTASVARSARELFSSDIDMDAPSLPS